MTDSAISHSTPGPEEIPLAGGNMNAGVVRVGDTVRRPAGPWTPAVHALLEHLHSNGFRGSPRPLGLDGQGREVLTYAEGPSSTRTTTRRWSPTPHSPAWPG
ncbi:hypothetical protein OG943_28775 [Amycolatopsis sp. NBC_00345]